MSVRLFRDHPSDAQKWDDFVRQMPEATSDHLWGWRRVLAESFGFKRHFYLGFEEHGELKGILPLFRVPKAWGRSLFTSIPYGNYGGVCAVEDSGAQALIGEANALARTKGAPCVELRQPKPLAHPKLKLESGTHSRFFLPITGDLDQHFKALGGNLRSKVRRAEKKGLRTFISRDVHQMYPIYLHTSRRQGAPCFPKKYFEAILRTFSEDSEIIFVAREDRVIAFYLVIYFKEKMIAQFAGSYEQEHGQYPNELLYWAAIQRACERGAKELDFCRSRKDSGCASFKRNLRYHEEPSDYQYLWPAGEPKDQITQAKSRVRWMMQAWKQLPMPVVHFLGPKVLRYFS